MARKFSNEEARTLIDQVNSLVGEADGLASDATRLHEELKREVDSALEARLLRVLRELPLDELSSRIPSGSLSVLKARGVSTLADLRTFRPADFDSQHAYDLATKSVEECVSRARENAHLRLDPCRPTHSALAVVAAAQKAVTVEPLSAQASDVATRLHEATDESLKDLNLGTGSIKWLFSSREKKDAAEAAYDKLRQVMASEMASSVRSLHDRRQAIETADYWASFRANQQSVLDTLLGIDSSCLDENRWPFLAASAKSLMDERNDLFERLDSSLRVGEAFETDVRKAAEHCLAREHLRALEEIPVEELNRGHRGFRIKALRDAGYENVADVYAASVYNIEAVRGVGESSAFEIKLAAADIASQAGKGAKLRISADRRDAETTSVVCSLYSSILYGRLADSCRGYRAQLAAASKELSLPLQDGAKAFERLYFDDARRTAAVQAYEAARGLLDSDLVTSTEQALSEIERLQSSTPSADEAWAAFSSDSVRFINELERIDPGILGNGDGMYGLPEDLARAVQEECFFPDGLLCTLRRYQEWGVKYILHQKRVLLGDEMGLGKTVQAIATMVSLKNTGASHFMVICPLSVLENWCREVRKHSKLRVSRIYGPGSRRAFENWKKTGGVAVTTYETTGRLALGEGFSFDLAIVDEAHYIKNPNAARTKNTVRLCGGASRLLFMTGTALENKVDEMVTLLEYLQPDVAREARKLAFMSGAQQFRDAVAPVYYRRKREDVLTELPDLIENEEWCSLGVREREAYERAVLSKNFMASRRVSWNVEDPALSSKAKRLQEIASDVADDGRKLIVFTFFRDTARMVAEMLGRKCVGVIAGDVPVARRQEMVERLEEAKPGAVLVSQIQAGGTGMNIQAANVVVICEPQFKPSIENQAISRAYRMGQSRNVLVYRLLCEGTVDEKMMDVLKEKQVIFNAFADKSSAAAETAEQDVKIDNGGFGKIIEDEIERIRKENPELAAKVDAERAKAGAADDSAGSDDQSTGDSAWAPLPFSSERSDEDPRSEVPASSGKARFCIHCGAELPEYANFCPVCGRSRNAD